MLRWAIVGTGAISHRIAPDFRPADGNVVAVACGRSIETARALAEAQGIPEWSGSYDDVLARDDVDAVYLATPIATHLPLALRALGAGKHVLVEKSMAMSAAEVEELFDAAARAERFAMEAMWMRFNPLHLELADRVAAGAVGEVRSVRAGFGAAFPPGGSRWDAALGGSAVLDQGIYPITLAQTLLGEPVGIRAHGLVRDGVDVRALIDLDFAGGAFAQLAVSALEFLDQAASISGTTGWVAIDRMFWAGTSASLYLDGPASLVAPPERLELPREGAGFVPMLRSVAEAIGAGLLEHPRHDRASTLAVARTMDVVRAQLLAP